MNRALGRRFPVDSALALLALPILVLIMHVLGVPLGLMLLLATGACIPLLLRPHLATVAVGFLLYTNVPVIAYNDHGVPQAVAGSFILLLAIPLLHFLVFRREAPRFDAVFGLMLAFLVVQLLSSIGAPDAAVARGNILKYVMEGILLYWLVVNVVRSLSIFRQLVWSVLAAGVLLGSLATYQSATGSFDQQFGGLASRKLEFEIERGERVREEGRLYSVLRASGPGLGHNRYAQTMIVLLPLAFFTARRSRSPRGRIAAIGAGAVILLGGVYLTYSRGAFLTLAVLVCVAGALGWVRRSHLLALGVSVVVLLPVVAPVAYNRINTLQAVTALDDPTVADGSLRGRATQMLAAYHAFRDHPILGLGPGQYHRVYSTQYHQISGIQFRDIRGTRRAHNLYLEMAADTGLVGISVFLAIPLLLLRGMWVERRRWLGWSPVNADLATALILSLLGFLTSAIFLSHAFERYYWFLIALAGSALHLLREAAKTPSKGGARPEALPAGEREVGTWSRPAWGEV